MRECHIRRFERDVDIHVGLDVADGILVIHDSRCHVGTIHPQASQRVAVIRQDGEHRIRTFLQIVFLAVVPDDIVAQMNLTITLGIDGQDEEHVRYHLILSHQFRVVLDVLDGIGVFGYLRRDIRAVECDTLHAPVFSRTEGDGCVLSVLNPEHHRRILHHLVVVAHVTLTDGDDSESVVDLFKFHRHLHVLVEVFDEVFALDRLFGSKRIHHQTVSEQTVGDQRVVHSDVLDLIALI